MSPEERERAMQEIDDKLKRIVSIPEGPSLLVSLTKALVIGFLAGGTLMWLVMR